MTVLAVENLRTHFFTRDGVAKAVDGVSFNIAQGEVLGLVGESGSGKTVTGFSLLGLVDPPGRIVAGSIRLDGEELVGAPEEKLRALRGRKIAMIFQDPMMTLNPVLRIDTQMIEAITAHEKVSWRAAHARAVDALRAVGIASAQERLSAYPHQFSGGMRQRVAIAIALLHRPRLLIADEPTTALDVTIQSQILAEVQSLCAESGTALIWITHDLAVVAGLADRIAVMYAGRIVEEGPVDALFARPLHPYTRGLIGSVPSRDRRGALLVQIPGMPPSLAHLPPGCAFAPRCAARRCRLRHGAGHGGAWPGRGCALLASASRERGAGMSVPKLELTGVSKNFVKPLGVAERAANLFGAGMHEIVVRAVDGVDLSVEEGEVVGLVGESGCGKSTLGRMIAGIIPPSEGEVKYGGRTLDDLVAASGRKALLEIQMIFQDPMASLNPRMRVRDIVGEAPVVHGIVSQAERDRYVDAMLARVGLDPGYKSRYPHQFSGGQRARIGIARALAVKPEFLVCDESVASLDVSIKAQVLNLFMQLRRDLGLTCLFISHDLGVVEHISDRIVIMYLGRVVEIAPTEALFRAPNHPYTQALLANVPRLEARKQRFTPVKGEIPSPFDPPSGCHFHPRCPFAMARCRDERPALAEIAPGRWSACHLNDGA